MIVEWPSLVAVGGRLMQDVRNAHPSLEELTAFDRGHLRPAEREAIERHIAACDVCCQRLDSVSDDDLIALLRTSVGLMSPAASRDTRDLPADTPHPTRGRLQVEPPVELLDHPRYRVLGSLGAGGMGVVFKAEHRLMERTVALKIIRKDLTQQAECVERFRQEVKAAARLSHPNIVAAYDAEQAGDLHFLVMEYIEGTSLDQRVRTRGPLPVALAGDIAYQVALGLQHAHERGMVHRDIKPQNLLLTPAGQVKILDFGLARFCRENSSGSLTAPGVVLGTPEYVAPEQALDARQADIRADLYSLGCTLYFLLAGRPPFSEGSTLQKLMAHQQGTPLPLAEIRPDVPAELLRVVERLTAKDPAQRYQTPAEVADQLAPFADRDTISPAATAIRPAMRREDAVTISFTGERNGNTPGWRGWFPLIVAAAVVMLALLLCGLVWWQMHERSQNATMQAVSDAVEKDHPSEGEM
ncbi:MAG TPA: serine/threonine-protein kinase, partial [Gemmataceae bacterium]|nr:serine/threonine-protein kinase [Gemmataceae bacterium]